MERYLIQVDYENNDDAWWDAARSSVDCPKVLQPIVHGNEDEVVVTARQLRQAEVWAGALPGWDEGPQFAPHPLLMGNPAEEEWQ